MWYGSAACIEEALELAVSARSNFARSIAMSGCMVLRGFAKIRSLGVSHVVKAETLPYAPGLTDGVISCAAMSNTEIASIVSAIATVVSCGILLWTALILRAQVRLLGNQIAGRRKGRGAAFKPASTKARLEMP